MMNSVRVLYLNPHGERAGAERMLETLIHGHLRRTPVRFWPVVVCGTDGAFSESLRQTGVNVEIHQLRYRRLLDSVSWLRGQYRSKQIRLVHTTMAHYHQFAWLAARGQGIPCIWFNHGPCTRKWWKGLAQAFPADATLTMGQYMETCHRGATLSPGPRIVRYALENRWLVDQPELRRHQRSAWNVGDGEVAVGNLGRIEEWKRQHCFLEAIATMPIDIVQRCRFFIGGTAVLGRGHEYLAHLHDLHRRHRFRDRITMTGMVDAEAFWEAMDVAVHCSEREPFGYVVLEAMAKGKLVIAANSGGVPEMLTDGQQGYLVDPEDTARFATTLSAAIQDYASLEHVRQAARETVRTRFSQGRMVDEIEELYSRLLGSGESSRVFGPH